VIKIDYNLTSYEDFFRHIAKCLKLKISENIITLTPDKGMGYIKYVNLMNGLQLLIYDYSTVQDIIYYRKNRKKNFMC
jgi:hypothetical protein